MKMRSLLGSLLVAALAPAYVACQPSDDDSVAAAARAKADGGGAGAGASSPGDGTDAGAPPSEGGAPPGTSPPPTDPHRAVLYLGDRAQSPITPYVADRMKAILAKNPARSTKSFLRLGCNLSNAIHLLGCLDGKLGTVDLGALASTQPTIDWFKQGRVGADDPFAHTVDLENVNVDDVLNGLYAQERDATNAAFAMLMFGSFDVSVDNDIRESRKDDPTIVDAFGPKLLTLVDGMIGDGIVPLLRSTMPRGPSNAGPFSQRIPMVNLVSRAIAQARQVPYAEFYADVAAVASTAMDSDGYHLTADPNGACVLRDASYAYGDNRQNRVALEQLDRAKRAVVDGVIPDADGPVLAGDGTAASPVTIPSLPFTDARALAATGASMLTDYGACGGATNESAVETVYALSVTAKTKVRALVFDRKGSGVATSIHHLASGTSAASCKSSNGALLELELAPGMHYFVVDGVPGGAAASEYLFAIDRCADGDATCIAEP